MLNDRAPSAGSAGESCHFKTLMLDGGILLAGFDYSGKSANVLNPESVADWQKIVLKVQQSDEITGVVLVSLKEGIFCAGADLEQIHEAQRSRAFGEIEQLVTTVHTLFEIMARSTKPFVAAVEGACLGGGFELALACHARIASGHPKTCFSLPEVRLGILPGFGGTQRLPRLIGLPAALDLITSGKLVFPRQALRMGLVDGMVSSISSGQRTLECIQKETLVQAAVAKARALVGKPQTDRLLPVSQRVFALPVVRTLLCRYARRQVVKRVRRFYPAPLMAIDAVQRGLGVSVSQGALEVEKPRLLDLVATPVSAHLVSLFLAGETLKRSVPSAPLSPLRVGVMGGGLMGSQIARLLAEKDYEVVLRDLSPATLTKAMGRMHEAQMGHVKKRIILPSEMRIRMMRIYPTIQARDLASAPFVIEAVAERLEVKQAVLAEFEKMARPDAVFATNTSSYTLTDIAAKAVRPDRCVGLHFFNPVAKLQLVEVVRAPFTSDAALAKACGLTKRLGKFPLVVNDGPGFLVNRILSRYLAEAVIMASEGVPIHRIDAVAKNFGMAVDSGRPMGPLELIDLIGLPVAIHVLTSLAVLGSRIESRDALLQSMLPKGRSPVTFWKQGKENPEAVAAIQSYRRMMPGGGSGISDDMIQKRLFLPMVDEALRCLHDKIVEESWQVDFAMLHGTGFPAFRGGLVTWARQAMTPAGIDHELQSLTTTYGKRFEPCGSLSRGSW